jgi:uncharacterized protein YjiS (DUF1127 family)
MREFVLHYAESRKISHVLALIPNWIQNWLVRREFTKLSRMTDYQLRDIGLTRDEALRLSRLPLSVDPVWEAERLRLINANAAQCRKV